MISGIFENCIGTINAAATLKYWGELGYQQIQQGQLSAEQSGLLYQHPAALTSWRLQNGDSAAHGLVRIMLWSQPRNAGLEKTLPMVVGSRWFASLTQDIYTIADAFADDKANGGDWIYTEPVRAIEGFGNLGTGLYNRFVGVREMFVIGRETRQAFFQRYNYTRPGYGAIAPHSPLKVSHSVAGVPPVVGSGEPLRVSEGTHSSLVSADHHLTSFYTEVFGLIASEINHKRSGYQNPSTRQTLILEEGQEFYLSIFSSPKDIAGVLQIYTPLYSTPDQREFSQPGSLGLSLFTYQVEDIQEFHQRVSNSNATHVTPIVSNEFGEPSFGLIAPDGFYWVILRK